MWQVGVHELEEPKEVGGWWGPNVKGLLYCAEGFGLNQVSEREHYQLLKQEDDLIKCVSQSRSSGWLG